MTVRWSGRISVLDVSKAQGGGGGKDPSYFGLGSPNMEKGAGRRRLGHLGLIAGYILDTEKEEIATPGAIIIIGAICHLSALF